MKIANLVPCDTCSKNFNKPKCHIKRTKNNYCSFTCFNKRPREFLEKLCQVCNQKFTIRPSENKKYITCGKRDCVREYRKGKNNPNWQGGIYVGRTTSTQEYKEWRKSVFERDNYTCQMCGQRGGKLEADHIKPWAYFKELRFIIENGRTLCRTCHITTFKRR